jgi:glycosyltransferase involved in cell wall biosynthesis
LRIEKSPYAKDIVVTGPVKFADLAVLYRMAILFLWPSLYEGFGIPLLEAFSSGTPVVSSGNSSMPEIIGKSGALIAQETSVESWVRAIEQLLGDAAHRQMLVESGKRQAKKFSWDRCARETLGVLLAASKI